jgi:hypothetical protein
VAERAGPLGASGTSPIRKLVPTRVAAPVFAVVLLGTAVLALATASHHAVRPRRLPRALLLGYGWLVTFALLVVVPDARVLIVLGYAPMLIIGAPFGWPPVDYADIFDWALFNKLFAVAGGLLLARALLTWQFRTADGCVSCGRRAGGAGWTTAASAARWLPRPWPTTCAAGAPAPAAAGTAELPPAGPAELPPPRPG